VHGLPRPVAAQCTAPRGQVYLQTFTDDVGPPALVPAESNEAASAAPLLAPEALIQNMAAAFAEGRAWTAKEFSSLLQSRGAILCGDVRSFILGRVIADEAEVLTLATDPAFRRQGRAAAALAQFVHDATQAGATRIFLEVATASALISCKNSFRPTTPVALASILTIWSKGRDEVGKCG